MAAQLFQKRKFGAFLITGGVVTLTLGLLAPGVGAASVDPVLIDAESYPGLDNYKNPTCGDLGFDDEFKIDASGPEWSDAEDGEYPLDSLGEEFEGEVLEILNSTSKSFDFTSTTLVSAVVVKASDEGWLYDYTPDGTLGDDDLISPEHGISHVSFCFGGLEPTTTTTEATTTTTEATTTTGVVVVEDTVIEQTTTSGARVLGTTLARTGNDTRPLLLMAGLALMAGGIAVYFGESPAAARRRS